MAVLPAAVGKAEAEVAVLPAAVVKVVEEEALQILVQTDIQHLVIPVVSALHPEPISPLLKVLQMLSTAVEEPTA